MADSRDGTPGNRAPDPLPWDREPGLVSLEIATWEHAARVPESWGRAGRVADLQRLLPHALTEPIYTRLAEAEALFLRRTEPIPPLRERLARDFDARNQDSEPGDAAGAQADDGLTLEGELRRIFPATRLGEFVSGWDAQVAAALGASAEGVATRIRDFASLGLPRAEFSMWYGYKFSVRRIPHSLLGPALATHGALLMGCTGPVFQPSLIRDVCDPLFG